MNRKNTLQFSVLVFLMLLTLQGAGQNPQKQKQGPAIGINKTLPPLDTQAMAENKRKVAAQFAQTQFATLVTRNADKGFGYFIFADSRLIIDQKIIPALSGNQSFVSEQEAKRTAQLAIKKIKQGEMPPTISIKELRELKIHAQFPPEKPLER